MTRMPAQQQQRQRSIGLVMRSLRRLGAASRSDLAELTGLDRSTLTRIAGELIGAGLVEEGGEAPSGALGGRRRQLLHLSPDRYAVCGCDIQPEHADWCLVGISGEIIREGRLDRPTTIIDPAEWLALIPAAMVKSLQADDQRTTLLAFGVGVPGPLSGDRQTLLQSTVLHVQDVSLTRAWGNAGFPVLFDNDANCGAWNLVWETEDPTTAILVYPRIHRLRDAAVAPSGAGMGLSLVVDGEIHYGSTGASGELRGYRWSQDSLDSLGVGLGRTHRDSGEEGMVRLLAAEVLRNVGVVASVLDPDRVVLSGDLSDRAEIVRDVIETELATTIWSNRDFARRLEVARAAQFPVGMGAARMVLHEYFRLPTDGATSSDSDLSWLSILE